MPTLDWLNRANAFTLASKVPYRLLEQVSTYHAAAPSPSLESLPLPLGEGRGEGSPLPTPISAPPATDNLLIQGDNLEALKALLPFYRGQVKCIFIDPPYNTKSAFEHYDDTNDDSKEKRRIGERWALVTGQRFVMVEKMLGGLDMTAQIRAALR
jgi:adenine-specific DNA-methyltransferase